MGGTGTLQRKVRKLLRDPKLFIEDAVRKRVSMEPGPARRPYTFFEGRAEQSGFSAETLLEQIAARYPVLHTVDETDFGFGVLEKHAIGVIQTIQRFAEAHGHQLTIQAHKTVESPTTGISEALMKAMRRAHCVTVRIDGIRHTMMSFQVFFYRKSGGALHSRGRVQMKHIPREATDRIWDSGGGQYWPSDLLAGLASPERTEEIDMVYTWVDSTDEKWRGLYESFYGEKVDQDRFSSRDEMKYSMRSLHYYCGWVRKIYIVTNCAPPSWIDLNHPKVEWIDHTEVLKEHNLPTFNCHAIETGLLDIPGLSNRFVYLNDDFFVTKPLRKRAFFDEAGRSYAFLEPQGKLAPDRKAEEESWYHARLTAQRRLLEEFGYAATRIGHHAPYVVLKDRAREMFADFSEDVERIAGRRRRALDDIPLLSFLYLHYSIAKGFGLYRPVNAQILGIGELDRFELSPMSDFLCINDGGGSADDDRFVKYTAEFMEQRFPHKAPWER